MKILIVCSGNADNFDLQLHHAFVYEQIESLKKDFDVEYDTFYIIGNGIMGYLANLQSLKKKIKSYLPDIVHAHYGLSGLLACLQNTKPVVITFHGSDAYIPHVKILSEIAASLSSFNIFVGDKIKNRIRGNKRFSIIPCGINLDIFYPVDMKIARDKLNMDPEKKYILFNSQFDRTVKNSPLAFSAIKKLKMNYELLELKDRTREEVNLLLNACNLMLLTSISEGSPQLIKEAMACNCPIVATDVGDIREVISNTAGCYLTSFEPDDVADKIKLAIEFNKKTIGRERIKHFDNRIISNKIFEIYQRVMSRYK